MKKFLSIALAAMMLVSLFAVNVSAAPEAVYSTDAVYDYALNGFDAAETGFTDGTSATSTVVTDPEDADNNVMKLDVDASTRLVYAEQALPAGAFVVEFDVYAEHQGLGLVFNMKNNGTAVNVGITGYSMDNGKWYTYRMTFNGTAITSIERTIKGENAWSAAAANSSYFNAFCKLTNNTDPRGNYYNTNKTLKDVSDVNNYIAFGGVEPQYGNATSKAKIDATLYPEFYQGEDGAFVNLAAADSVYYIDNLKIYHEEEVLEGIIDTLYLTQDYEGTETAATSATSGAAEKVTVSGNTYLVATPKADNAALILPVATLPEGTDVEDVEICFDLMAEAEGTFIVEITQTRDNDEHDVNLSIDEMDLGDWYSYRVCIGGADDAFVARKNLTDNGAWEVFEDFTTDGNSYNNSDRSIRFGQVRTTENAAACVWNIDNIKATSKEFIKVTDIEAEGTTVSAAIDFSNGGVYNIIGTTEKYTVMMASYEGGVLADVDFEVVTPDGVAATGVDLSVDKTNDVRIYVWNADNTPVLTNVFDLDAWF